MNDKQTNAIVVIASSQFDGDGGNIMWASFAMSRSRLAVLDASSCSARFQTLNFAKAIAI